ncbi:hypothetical protein [Alloactinosynnema sp. L-07]|uniref:HNH endonuclease signature motif containing protein n=1 Tax=Alloactinosynnema sp. L-07 TaxID=1653480 RepID=UPI00065EF0D0|nr:HNH endonuclease signature motif containing protein [Alloactinosynnema sp. L-07]CRK56985.1 hypothetical protein [Alloactinosynnema sp. L-07]
MTRTLLPVPLHATAKAWERFSRKIVITSNHHIWVRSLADDGYGRFHDPNYTDADLPAAVRSDIVRVSRWIWWAHYGPIPPRTVIMHTCNVPICVRLDHLRAGTQQQNLLMAAELNRLAHTGGGSHRIDRADKRGQAGQSHAIRQAVLAAITEGTTDPDALATVVEAVLALGDAFADQLSLFDI